MEHTDDVLSILLLDGELDLLALVTGPLLAPEVALAATGDHGVEKFVLLVVDLELKS